ncbi:MAG: thioredoxin domain-containing protein [Chloroflexi bacterium]|nr:thioredoxin domain-containing protein [Chloroflexota bacterium]
MGKAGTKAKSPQKKPPIRTHLYLVARVALGIILIFSAATKLVHPVEFAASVQAYGLLPLRLVDLVAAVLPWIELLVGTFLLFGLLNRVVLPIAGLMLGFFVVLMAVAFAQGKQIDCGCFVGVIDETVGPLTLLRDVVIVSLVVPAYLSSSHRLSLDTWLQSKPALSLRGGFAALALAAIAIAFGMLVPVFAGSFGPKPPTVLAGQSDPTPSSNAQPSTSPAPTQAAGNLSPGWRLGPATARVVITEFGDFQCPACRVLAPVLKQVVKEYNGQVALVFRHFPLSYHENAIPSAIAAEAAGQQGKFWEMYDLMYADQEHIAPADLRAKAAYLGLDMRKFDEALRSEAIIKKIQADVEEGKRVGLKYTPWIIVNNQVVPTNSYQAVKSSVERALKD